MIEKKFHFIFIYLLLLAPISLGEEVGTHPPDNHAIAPVRHRSHYRAPGNRSETLKLAVLSGEQAGKCFAIPVQGASIGPDPSNTICLEADSVSSFHAEIVALQDGVYGIRDLGSTNGTFVGGTCINSGPVRLACGSEVNLGLSIIRFD